MEALLENGDHLLDHQGMPRMIDGIDAVLQRALLRLRMKRGTLAYDPQFGSLLHRLSPIGERGAQNAQALACAREALSPMAAVDVKAAACAYDATTRRLTVRLRLTVNQQDYTLEVKP